VRFAQEELERFAAETIAAVGSSDAEADIVARCLVGADLRGIHSHGVIRLGVYVRTVQQGGIVPDADMRWLRNFGSVAILDGASGYGQTALVKAMDKAEELSDEFGQATITIHHATHYGAGAFWAEMAAERGLVSLLVTSTGPCVAPFGSKDGIFGTNPITLGTPAPGGDPIIADMATSVVAYGKIMAHHSDGLGIPDDWALDGDGRPTTDAAVALDGALRTFGEHKGSGLAFFVEVLAGAFSDSRFSYEALDINKHPSSKLRVGHTLMTWKPEVFRGDDRYLDRVGDLAEKVRSAAPAEGFDRVRLPGEVEFDRMAQLRREGVVLPGKVPDELGALATEFGIDPPATL
jgi:L-2-hydroxycarboxylate dehydrogenase (NAD+)